MRIPSGGSSDDEPTNYGPDDDDRQADEPESEYETWKPRSHGRFRKSAAPLGGPEDASIESEALRGEEKAAGPLAARARKYCSRGKAFYRCANGFIGCCSNDPCNPGGTCLDGSKTSHQKETTKSTSYTQRTSQHMTTGHSESWPHAMPTTSHDTKQSTSTKGVSHSDQDSSKPSKTVTKSDESTKGSTSSTSSATMASGTPPTCPSGNGTHYVDSSKKQYQILCGTENTFQSYNSVWFENDAYSKCFSACSDSDKCAGFTFVGTDHGNCYQKTQMPNNSYVAHEGYITAAKVDSPHNTGTGQTSSPKKAGIIAGSVLGTIILLCLIVFLVIWCAKRRRKKVDERRAAEITPAITGPIEMQPYRPPTDHQRQGSTSHDFQSQAGGHTPGYFDTPAKAKSQVGNRSPAALVGLEQTLREQSNPDVRPESGFIPMILPTPNRSPNRDVSTIDSPTLGQQSADSKSLANDVRRKQYLANQVPPSNTPSPRASPPIDGDGNRWREI